MPKASGPTQTGDRQDGKGSDSSVVPVRRKYNVKGMPEHIKEMARYATLAFDALNRSKFKTFCIAKAKEFGTTEKKIRRAVSKYRNDVREGKINDERDKFLSKQRASRRWEIQWYNDILYIITNFDSLRKKERKLHIIKLASNTSNVGLKNIYSHKATLKNSLCGDKITLELIAKKRKIFSMKYETNSCVYCEASASLLSKKIKNLNIEDIKRDFKELKRISGEDKKNLPKKFSDFKQLFNSDNNSRFKCIFLPFDAVLKALK